MFKRNVNIYEFETEYFHNPTTYDELEEQLMTFYTPSSVYLYMISIIQGLIISSIVLE